MGYLVIGFRHCIIQEATYKAAPTIVNKDLVFL